MPRKPAAGGVVTLVQHQDTNDNWAEGGPDLQAEAEAEEGEEEAATSGQPRAKTSREANLTAQCLVCGGRAAAHQHYGAICCYSCRAFFRRGITRQYSCVRGDHGCQVNSITRTNCKKCRLERCLQVGMRPELVDATLRRKQEEKRRQEIGYNSEVVQETVAESETQAVTGMMQLQQGGHSHRAVLAAVQGLQQPLPRHQLLHQPAARAPAVTAAAAAAGGRKKVLLELRHSDPSSAGRLVSPRAETLAIQSSQLLAPAAVSAPHPSQPLRQQTYFIFHPNTQTFEPITIAEFEENAVVEEVVVGDDFGVVKEAHEDSIASVNEHDYTEIHDSENGEGESLDHVNGVGETIVPEPLPLVQEGEHKSAAIKPVISPVIREGRKRSPSQTDLPKSELKILRVESQKSSATSISTQLSQELIEEAIKTTKQSGILSNDLQRVIEETLGETPPSITNDVSKQFLSDEEKNVNIEDLVDVCFEEEMSQKPADEPELEELNLSKSRKKIHKQSGSPLPLKKRLQ